MRTAVLILLALAAAGCGRPDALSDADARDLAIEAVQSHTNLPDTVTWLPVVGSNDVYFAKNAARVDVSCDVPRPDGAATRLTYSVWMKRVANRWEPGRVYQSTPAQVDDH